MLVSYIVSIEEMCFLPKILVSISHGHLAVIYFILACKVSEFNMHADFFPPLHLNMFLHVLLLVLSSSAKLYFFHVLCYEFMATTCWLHEIVFLSCSLP
jgi:hypothetical protein